MKFRLGAVSLQVSIRQVGDVTILDLRGRSTIGSDTELLRSHLQALVANRVHKLLLNLAELTQIDSSAVSILVRTYVSLTHLGGELKLLRPSGRVLMLLNMIHLLDIIPSFEDETQALASFQTQGYSARP
jgi:anti-sigma B factor antagonist